MHLLAAIYGFEVTRPIRYGTWCIEPISDSYRKAHELARDLEAYHLTALLKGDALSEKDRFHLEAVLSFIEHLDVIIFPANLPNKGVESAASNIPSTLRRQRRSSGGGAVIGADTFFRHSRSDFVTKAMTALSDDNYCKSTKFNILLFKCVETFRQRSPFLEITYFLLYSGIESFARTVLNDSTTRNASKLIHRLLKSYDFNVLIDDPSNLPRSINTYTRLRNSLFHNSEFSTVVRLAGAQVQLDASTYLFHLSMLVSLVIMKAVKFDDGHTNWDAWIDRQLHC